MTKKDRQTQSSSLRGCVKYAVVSVVTLAAAFCCPIALLADAIAPGTSPNTFATSLPTGLTFLADETVNIIPGNEPGLAGSVTSAVYNDGNGGELFAYQVTLTAGDTNEVAISGFTGFTFASFGLLGPAPAGTYPVGSSLFPFADATTGVTIPTNLNRTHSGAIVNIQYNGTDILGPSGSPITSYVVWLDVNNTTAYGNSQVDFLDDNNGSADALAPAVPEPRGIVGIVGLSSMLGIGLICQRRRRAAM